MQSWESRCFTAERSSLSSPSLSLFLYAPWDQDSCLPYHLLIVHTRALCPHGDPRHVANSSAHSTLESDFQGFLTSKHPRLQNGDGLLSRLLAQKCQKRRTSSGGCMSGWLSDPSICLPGGQATSPFSVLCVPKLRLSVQASPLFC